MEGQEHRLCCKNTRNRRAAAAHPTVHSVVLVIGHGCCLLGDRHILPSNAVNSGLHDVKTGDPVALQTSLAFVSGVSLKISIVGNVSHISALTVRNADAFTISAIREGQASSAGRPFGFTATVHGSGNGHALDVSMPGNDADAGVVCCNISTHKPHLSACLTIFGLGIGRPPLAFPALPADDDICPEGMLSNTCRSHIFLATWVTSLAPTETKFIAASRCSAAVAVAAVAAAAAAACARAGASAGA
mmetsp:Transcript_86280/g.166058  ORF Transcript_86280/g.166058 Transcript_86280/m.166058 type:complete len:246 (+) Transcript_86280:925-1662(+)